MIVVKLGGSLTETGTIRSCLRRIAENAQNRPIAIVPGGGLFAEQVRAAQQKYLFDNRTAHAMALLAMQQMALMFKALQPEFDLQGSLASVRQTIVDGRTVIWSPLLTDLDMAGIPSSWDVTSDSLAAWLANELAADRLILVKSVNIAPETDALKLAELKVVDASFPHFTQKADYRITVVHAEKFISEFQ